MSIRADIERAINKLNESNERRHMRVVLYPEHMEGSSDIGMDAVIVQTRTMFRPSQVSGNDLIVNKLIEEIEQVEGVQKVIIGKFEIYVHKASMFSWDEILPDVLNVIETFDVNKKFVKDGLKGIVGVDTGSVN